MLVMCCEQLGDESELIKSVDVKGKKLKFVSLNNPNANNTLLSEIKDNQVVVKVKAFSCNYRDISVLHESSKRIPPKGCMPIGSEFCGEIVKVGSKVTSFNVGEQVIPNYHYQGMFYQSEESTGIYTNNASSEYLILNENLLIAFKGSVEEGAVFSLAAQTVFSMLRKAEISQTDNILITSASSNTSLALISALNAIGIAPSIITSKDKVVSLQALFDLKYVYCRDDLSVENAREIAKRDAVMDVVFDPFFDVNARVALRFLKPAGKYLSCGVLKQSQDTVHKNVIFSQLDEVLMLALVNNIELKMNCLGETKDLEKALLLYSEGSYRPIIDSVFSFGEEKQFIERSFCSSEKIGKVVFKYESQKNT